MSMGPLYVLLGKVSIQVLHPFFNRIAYLPGVELYEFLIYFVCKPLIGYIICKYILPFNRLSIYFVDGFLCFLNAF